MLLSDFTGEGSPEKKAARHVQVLSHMWQKDSHHPGIDGTNSNGGIESSNQNNSSTC